jgi:hypothetical protein
MEKIMELNEILNELDKILSDLNTNSLFNKRMIESKCIKIIDKINRNKTTLLEKSLTMSNGKCPTCGK